MRNIPYIFRAIDLETFPTRRTCIWMTCKTIQLDTWVQQCDCLEIEETALPCHLHVVSNVRTICLVFQTTHQDNWVLKDKLLHNKATASLFQCHTQIFYPDWSVMSLISWAWISTRAIHGWVKLRWQHTDRHNNSRILELLSMYYLSSGALGVVTFCL